MRCQYAAAVIPMQWSATKEAGEGIGEGEGGHAAGAGQGECCCAQHDAGHALHDHNLQHTADLIAGPETADMPRNDTSLFGHLHRHICLLHICTNEKAFGTMLICLGCDGKSKDTDAKKVVKFSSPRASKLTTNCIVTGFFRPRKALDLHVFRDCNGKLV